MNTMDICIKSIKVSLDTVLERYEQVTHELNVLKEGQHHIVSENQMLKEELEKTKDKLQKAELQLVSLETDRKEFFKVSHVVSLEKENAKLQSQVQSLQQQLAAKIEQKPEIEQEDDQYYEKTIKGVTYYVHTISKKIYEKTEDDSVGEELGILETSTTGKSKVKWL